MPVVVFVAPYATPNTIRYLEALAMLDGVDAAAISSDPADRFPAALRDRLVAIETVGDCGNARQLAAAAQAIGRRAGGIDRIFGALEQLQMPIAEARDLLRLSGMGAAVTRRFRDKSVMKQALRDAGLPCARWQRAELPADVYRFADRVGYPLIIKPVDGLGTRATHRISSRRELEALLQHTTISAAHPVQVEEFLKGTEHSFESVTINGRVVWSSSTNYIPGPLEVIETPWIQYCVVLPRETTPMDAFSPINQAALAALGMGNGLSHMEWFLRPDGSMAVNEVGARPPGVNIMPLMSLAHDVDMVAAWIRLMALDEFTPRPRVRAAGTAFFRGQGGGARVASVRGLAEAMAEVGRNVVEIKAPQIGQPRGAGYEGEGYAIVAGDTTRDVLHALGRLIRTVQVEYG